jgi:cellulase (glycosyl hydrolase family 5)
MNKSKLGNLHSKIDIRCCVILIVGILLTNCFTFNTNPSNIVFSQGNPPVLDDKNERQIVSDEGQPYLGVNMRGYYTSMPQSREFKFLFPENYYETSFKTLSKANAIDHVRYRFYWESYVKSPVEFIKEIKQVAETADKYGLKVIYDNHQFHTSSWLNVARGTGFPAYLFDDPVLYKQGSGGAPKSTAAKTWWTNWWNGAVKSVNGTDGWKLQLDFLNKIVQTVDSHPSTLGYEILSEPQVHSEDQWAKIGKFNNYITQELRKSTNRTIVYSMNIPIDLKSSIGVNAENLAKMVPLNKENVVFKFSLYGIPSAGYQADKLDLFLNASRLAGVPLYIGEWNNVKRISTVNEEGKKIWEIAATQSDISQVDANSIVDEFKNIGIWGMAFWEWSFIVSDTPNFNLASVKFDNATGAGKILPTKYFQIVEKAYQEAYG